MKNRSWLLALAVAAGLSFAVAAHAAGTVGTTVPA